MFKDRQNYLQKDVKKSLKSKRYKPELEKTTSLTTLT